jgi:hypothetical protein
MPENQVTFLIIGVVFGSLAGLCAFFIAYSEHRQRMRALTEKSPEELATRTAIVTFLFFFLASCALPWILQSL